MRPSCSVIRSSDQASVIPESPEDLIDKYRLVIFKTNYSSLCSLSISRFQYVPSHSLLVKCVVATRRQTI